MDPSQLARRGRLAFGLATLGTVFLGSVAWRQWGTSDRERAASTFRGARHCLLGDEDGSALHRLRSRVVAADLDPTHREWPVRCGGVLRRLRTHVDRLLIEHRQACDAGACCPGDATCDDLEQLRDEIDSAFAFTLFPKRLGFDPTGFLETGIALGYDRGALPDGAPDPVPPAPMLAPAEMTPLFVGEYLRLLTDPDGDRGLDLLFYEHEAQYTLCQLDLQRQARARCRPLPAAIPVGLAGEILAGEDGAPRRLYAQGPGFGIGGWHHGLFDIDDGTELTPIAFRPQGGFVWRDGTTSWLGLESPLETWSVFVHEGGGDRPTAASRPPPLSLELGEVSAGPHLVHDAVVWTEPAPGGQHRVHVRDLVRTAGGGVTLSAPQVLGAVASPEQDPDFELCRTGDALAVMVHGRRNQAGLHAQLFFRTAQGWLPPVPVHVRARRAGFTCQGATATISWIWGAEETPIGVVTPWDTEPPAVRGRYHVERLRCRPSGCRPERTTIALERFNARSRYVAGDLGASTAVMWRSPQGDIRMKVAPLEQLPTAPEVPLFDDVEHDGFGWDLERDPIFGRSGTMVVLASRQSDDSLATETYAVVVDARGKVHPVEVTTDDAGGG
ncbi:MAG: hypothetical protein AAGN82_14570 [Myxococcota bacterium]